MLLTCIYCGRHDPPCGFYPIMSMTLFVDGAARSGQLCWDCDAWLRAGSPARVTPTDVERRT